MTKIHLFAKTKYKFAYLEMPKNLKEFISDVV